MGKEGLNFFWGGLVNQEIVCYISVGGKVIFVLDYINTF